MRKIFYLVAMLVAFSFVFIGCGNKPAGEMEKQGSDVEEFSATIEEMAKKGKPYQCEYSMTTDGITQEGVLYIAGTEKMRGDIVVDMASGEKSNTHFIKDGNVQYVWTDEQPQGMKMTITEEDMEKAKEMADKNQASVDMDTKVNLKCRKWSPDKGLLEPPSNIEFMDLTEMMNNLGAMTGAGSSEPGSAGTGLTSDSIDMCNICNQIPAGAARDSCKEQNC